MSTVLLLLALVAPTGPPAAASNEPLRPPWVLVLTDGRRLPLREEPRWVFGRASVADASGRRLDLRWQQVDHEATRRANPRETDAPDGLPRVWDEAALERLRGRRLNVVDNGGPAQPISPQSSPARETPGASEQQWRERATALRERIARLEAEIDYLDRARDSWESFALGTGGDYEAAAASKLGELRRARQSREQALQAARGQWAAVEEEARKARVPPGWLR